MYLMTEPSWNFVFQMRMFLRITLDKAVHCSGAAIPESLLSRVFHEVLLVVPCHSKITSTSCSHVQGKTLE